MSDAQAATLPHVLREQIMDSRIPKNEREHWAARHIAELETKCDQLATENERLREWQRKSTQVLHFLDLTGEYSACDVNELLKQAEANEAKAATEKALAGEGE